VNCKFGNVVAEFGLALVTSTHGYSVRNGVVNVFIVASRAPPSTDSVLVNIL
jgi:hypothetical protein